MNMILELDMSKYIDKITFLTINHYDKVINYA